MTASLKFGEPLQNLVDLNITGHTCLKELVTDFLQSKQKFAWCVRALSIEFLLMISPMDYPLINLLSLRSDQHLVSPYNITPNHTLRSQELRK